MNYEKISSLAVVLFILISGMVTSFSVGSGVEIKGDTDVFYVGGNGPANYTKIQNAINDSRSGDTVYIYEGEYYENLLINKSISIKGAHVNNTVISGNGITDVIEVEVNSVNISDVTIKGGKSNSGIFVNDVDNFKFSNGNILDNEHGIYLFDSDYANIENISIINNKYGLQITNSEYLKIANNSFENDSIVLGGNSLKEWNTHDIDRSNKVNGDPLIYYKNKSNMTIESNFGQIILANCTKFSVKNSIINNCSIAIELGFSSMNILSNLTTKSNSVDALYIYNSDNNIIKNSTINYNNKGICTKSSHNNDYKNISYNNNIQSMYLYNSDNNEIYENVFFKSNYSFYLYNSDYNLIYNNNIIKSEGFDNSLNYWNKSYPKGGNYWSDYEGTDLYQGPDQSQPGSDGIGDEPYSIPGDSNNDEYPLIEPYSIDENPPDINSVRVSNKTNNSATIEWNTSELCTSKLTYSSFSNMSSNRSLSNSSYTTIHRMEISNLSSDKAYYFQVSSMDTSGNWNTDDNNSNYYMFKTDSKPSTENEKPNIIDVTTQIPYTGDTILMEANVTDDSNVSSVFLNYRFDNTTGKNITIEKITDNYMSYITIPSNATIFEYQFIAKDDSNQWNNTNLTRLDVIDNDEPSLDDFSPDIGYTEENYTINISVEDNIKIKSVSLNYSYNSTYVSNITINHFNKSFITYPIKIPSDSIQLYYEILIFDFANNSIKENNTVEIKDNTNPIIKDVKIIEKEINVGTKTNFTINTKDNRGIDKIFLKVKNNKDIDTYQISENQGDIWFKTIQFNTLGNYTYWFYVEDSSNLVTKSSKNNFSVLDLTPLQVTTSIEKNIIKIDRSIKLKFNKNINRTSLSNGIEISPKRNYSLKWIDNKDVNISIIKPDPGKSFFLTINSSLVKDLNGVYLDGNLDGVATKNDEDNFYLNWTFETPPEIVNQNNDEIDKSSSFNLSAVVNDDFNISKVKLNYTDTNGCIYNISLQNNSGLWSTTIPRLNKSGILEYYVWAVDSSGLSTRSNNSTIEVNNPLEIICKNYSFQSNKQFKFSVSIKDPVGVKKVILIYENKKKIKKNLSLKEGDAGNGKWICDLELGKGEYNYSIEVVDMDGESKLISNDKSIEISESDSGILPFNHNFIFYLLLVLLTLAIAAISIYKLKDGGPNVTSKETIFDESVSDFTKKLDSKNKERCTICLDKFKKDTRIYECQGCEETYHINCIKQLNDCPVCGSSIKRIGGKDDRKE